MVWFYCAMIWRLIYIIYVYFRGIWNRLLGHKNDDEELKHRLIIKEREIDYRSQEHGPEHRFTLQAIYDKSIILFNLGRHFEAIRTLDKLIEVQNHVLGSHHIDILCTLSSKATALTHLPQYDKILALYENLIYLLTHLCGPANFLIFYLHHMANARPSSKYYVEALRIYDQIIEEYTPYLGLEHERVIKAMQDKAETLNKLRLHHDALLIYNEVIEILTRTHKPEFEGTLRAMENKAETLMKLYFYKESLALLKTIIQIRSRTIGREREETQMCITLKSEVLFLMGRRSEALKIITSTVSTLKHNYGEQYWATRHAKNIQKVLHSFDNHWNRLTSLYNYDPSTIVFIFMFIFILCLPLIYLFKYAFKCFMRALF
jgi:tetratricopeptide (TPR) repeat protein